MASQEWNFSSYFANLAQNAPTDDKRQYNFGYDHSVDDQRVFAELKPPCNNHLISGGANDHCEEGMLHFGTSNSVADAFVPNIFRPQSIKSELSTNTDNLENVIEQQLVSWDLNRLVGLGNDAIIGGVVDDDLLMLKSEEDWDVDCENAMQFLSQPNIDAQIKREGDIAQDEFQFPQCVEEQFRQLILRANEQEERQCTKCGGIAPRRDGNQTLYIRNEKKAKDDSNTATESKTTENLVVNCKSELNDEINSGSNDFVNSSYFQTSNSKEQSINAPEDKGFLPKDTLKKVTHNSGIESKIEDIDKVLTHIDPDLDVLGKTFHKIPSTQPIYCDEEPRNDENGNDNRIKRPMNAFMLWARKYRSLVAKEFSEASNSEISVKLGEIWNELTSDQQSPTLKRQKV
ncbi:uncharacterized protein LOC135696350 [Rhopilema esculentum]|uniref:uncharacterized protein LOC135696350 n=1 Tax=Rhopilema esculentum TaxID=499914 RepID=UPI0031E34D49